MAEWKRHATRPQPVFSIHWRRIVLDEAHDIRDSGCATAKAIHALSAHSRWAITGTPIQNNLSDLASLFKFLRVYPYDDERSFHMLADELCNASADGVERFKTLIGYIMLRRSIQRVELPDRRDLICPLEFTPEELCMYNRVKLDIRRISGDAAVSSADVTSLNILSWINRLLMVCNLGTKADTSEARELDGVAAGRRRWTPLAAQSSFNSLMTAGSAVCDACSTDFSISTQVADPTPGRDRRPPLSRCLRLICAGCQEKHDIGASCDHQPPCPTAAVSTLSSNVGECDPPSSGRPSEYHTEDKTPTKIRALIQDLRKHSRNEKSIVFSYWVSMLDHIKVALDGQCIESVRIDGAVSAGKREAALRKFREDDRVRVALLTISCGAVGLDLTAASRAYLMEPHWNPSVEQQALARIHRMGQKRPVTTVRYVMQDSYEQRVLQVQTRKQLLTDMLPSQKGSKSSRGHSERIEVLKLICVQKNSS